MNLLECHIVEIHSEEPIAADWSVDGYVIEVDLTHTCYGRTTRSMEHFSEDGWNKIKEQGYFLA